MNRRLVWVYALCLGLATVFIWWPGVLAMLAGIAARHGWGVRSRRLVLAGAGLMMLAPFVWLFANHGRLGAVSPQLVSQAPWPGRLAAAALALVVLGVVLELADIPDPKVEGTRGHNA